MRCRRIVLITSALLLLTFASFSFAQSTAPASDLAPPPTIDKLVPLAPISLKLNGLGAKEAFATFGHEVGITIVPAKYRETVGGTNAPPPLLGDFWRVRSNRKIDFDLDGVSFWQAMDRLMERADLHLRASGNNWMTIYPGFNRNLVSYTPSARVTAYVGPQDADMHFDLDPRLRLCSAGEPVIQVASDGSGHDVVVRPRPRESEFFWDGASIARTFTWAKGSPRGGRLAVLRGFLPVTVVTVRKEINLPLRAGAWSQVAGWTLTLIQTGDEKLALRQPGSFVTVEFQPPLGQPPAGPIDMRMLVELRDVTGAPLKPYIYQGTGTVAANGIFRQTLAFFRSRYDQENADAATLVIQIPTEIKEAIIPFEFNDIKLP